MSLQAEENLNKLESEVKVSDSDKETDAGVISTEDSLPINPLLETQNQNQNQQIRDINGFVETLSSTPTGDPKSFYGQVKIYNGAFYIYDNSTGSWLSASPQYATGTLTDSGGTGNHAITGLGFQPKMISIYTQEANTDGGQSWGSYTTTNGEQMTGKFWDGSNWTSFSSTVNIIRSILSGGGAESLASVVSLDSDGFTINWSLVGGAPQCIWQAYA